jgi:hypothetical protein
LLIKYGYHGLYGLVCLLNAEIERDNQYEIYTSYVGQTLWHLNTIAHLYTTAPNDMPQYLEIAHPEARKKEPTADEIKRNLWEKLRC